jgi:catechol 2,3-dioxygenase-like lactoylglutathione lyase family enzyme
MRKQSAFLNVVVRQFTGAARRLDPRPSESRPSSPSIRGDAAAAPPAFPPAQPIAWPHEDCANEPAAVFACGERNTLWALGARIMLVLLLSGAALSSQAAVREVGAIGLTVGDLDRVLPFYTNTLPFELKGIRVESGVELNTLLDLNRTRTRIAELKLGDERITLTEHLTSKGRPIPPDSRSFDHWFQHIAIVVSDMDKAYEHLRRAKVKHVSTAPQTLPAWNRDAGGIKAFYFRDPEDHVLEIIWFPPGKGDPKWQRQSAAGVSSADPSGSSVTSARKNGTAAGTPDSTLFLGIDHTAIVVSDTERSLAFYRDTLGMRVAGGAENYGTEQEHLNQVFGARLRITALRAERGPGIEFLEYITPPGGRSLPPDAKANDLVFWHTRLLADDGRQIAGSLRERGERFISRSPREAGAHSSFIVRDPDGHALHIETRANAAFSRN